jgi:hypothetical protein
VANGVVYVGECSQVEAFDAAGATNCSGRPASCRPLWSTDNGGTVVSPAVANGAVYVGSSRICDFWGCGGQSNLHGFALP